MRMSAATRLCESPPPWPLAPGAEASKAELKAFVAARFASFKVPVRLAFGAETPLRNANGKIPQAQIRALLAKP